MTVVYLIGFAIAVALVIAWIVLPFAVIGTKPILTELLQEVRRTNQLLAEAAKRDVPTLKDVHP